MRFEAEKIQLCTIGLFLGLGMKTIGATFRVQGSRQYAYDESILFCNETIGVYCSPLGIFIDKMTLYSAIRTIVFEVLFRQTARFAGGKHPVFFFALGFGGVLLFRCVAIPATVGDESKRN